jgi:uncharacterized protein
MSGTRRHRRLTIVVLAVSAALLALWLAHLPAMGGGLACLAPGAFAFLLLWLGHYPGHRAIAAVIAGPARRRRRARPVRRRPHVLMPRGGELLATALAGRAPPLSVAAHRGAARKGPQARATTNTSTLQEEHDSMQNKRFALLILAAALIVPASAQAHISLHPNTIPQGSFVTLDVRVPGEVEATHVTKVDMKLPSGFTGVDTSNVPGWNVTAVETKLTTPIKEGGETIDTEVSQVIWTWVGPLGQVNNGQFINFPLSIAMPEHGAGQALLFPTVETYANGQIVHWIESSLTAEHPAPRVNVTAPGGVVEEVAGHEAGPAPGQTGTAATAAAPVASTSSSGASKGLGIAALILGALGLIAGLAALAASRRNRST